MATSCGAAALSFSASAAAVSAGSTHAAATLTAATPAKMPSRAVPDPPPLPAAAAGGARSPANALITDENKAAAPPSIKAKAPIRASLDPSTMKGVPAMEIFASHERSWSIQDALDQHAALAEQREVLLEIGRNRIRVRQTQLSFAELEVTEAVDGAKKITAVAAGDAKRVMQLTSRVRAAVRDLRIASRMRQMEDGTVSKHLSYADGEIE